MERKTIGYLLLRLWKAPASGRANRAKLAHRLRLCSQFGAIGSVGELDAGRGAPEDTCKCFMFSNSFCAC